MSKITENTQKWRKTKRGLVTNLYHKMRSRHPVDFDLNYFHDFANCKKFDRLYNEWVKSNFCKQFKPSIDRISNKGIYSKENIQWLTWSENKFKQGMETRHKSPPVNQILGDKIIKTYKSQNDVVIKTGICQSNISDALNGKRKLCRGYKWEYAKIENPELL
jgi:hypothetical protein